MGINNAPVNVTVLWVLVYATKIFMKQNEPKDQHLNPLAGVITVVICPTGVETYVSGNKLAAYMILEVHVSDFSVCLFVCFLMQLNTIHHRIMSQQLFHVQTGMICLLDSSMFQPRSSAWQLTGASQ